MRAVRGMDRSRTLARDSREKPIGCRETRHPKKDDRDRSGFSARKTRPRVVGLERSPHCGDALQPLDQALTGDPKNARGARAVAFGELEHAEDVFLLDLGEGLHPAVFFAPSRQGVPQHARDRLDLCEHLAREVVLAEHFVVLEENDALEEISKLADVSGPAVRAEDGLDLGVEREETLPELLVVER